MYRSDCHLKHQVTISITREGFIGGGISTVFISVALSYFMCQYNYFICPIGEVLKLNNRFTCVNVFSIACQKRLTCGQSEVIKGVKDAPEKRDGSEEL